MTSSFSEIVTTEEQFRAVMGHAAPAVRAKALTALDEHCRAFIERSPFVLIGSADAAGHHDVSPKGDPPGFVQVLDDHTLAIPDRPGNRLADTFRNILEHPHVGLLFLIPGKQETLRVAGKAMIVRDAWLCGRMAINGKVPQFAIVVTVESAFFHCAKCVIRSKIWDPQHWPQVEDLSSLARVLIDHAKLPDTEAEMHAMIDSSYRDRLY